MVGVTQLSARDLRFIPAGWFHTLLHGGEFNNNSNVNFWWNRSGRRGTK